jgi:predicted RNA-binding protein with EMAP domain
MHDTANDPRLLVAEHALKLVRENIFSRGTYRSAFSKDQIQNRLANIESQLMVLKYKYMSPQALAEGAEALAISRHAVDLRNSMAGMFHSKGAETMVEARLAWSFRMFEGLPARLARANDTSDPVATGVDIVAITIRNVVKKDQYWHTKVMEGGKEYLVVTNIEGLQSGMRLGAAILPPATVGGVISQAMFLGRAQRKEGEGAFIAPGAEELKEASAILLKDMGKKK